MKSVLIVALGVLAGFVGFVWVQARSNEARAEAAFPPEGKLIQVNGKQVHAVVLGSGPDLVLIHGSSGNTRDFTFALAGKLAATHRVIVFDRPGLGYSDPVDASGSTIRQQAEQLSDAAKALGAKAPVVLGHSYGGAVALAWAIHRPDHLSGLVLVGAPSQPWNTPLDGRYRRLSHPLIGPPLAALMAAFVGEKRISAALESIFAPNEVPNGYAAHVGAGLTLRRASLRANALQRANLLAEITALQPHYGQVNVPVEIVHGMADTTVGLKIHAKPLAAQIPQANLRPLRGVGHMPHHAAQAEVIAAIARVGN